MHRRRLVYVSTAMVVVSVLSALAARQKLAEG